MAIFNMVGGGGGGTIPNYLCLTANTSGSTAQLTQIGTPTAVALEISRDGISWNDYSIGTTITLSNAGDKVYFRNTSETDTGFSISTSKYYKFVMTGSVSASGDVNYLLNKNSTTTVSSYCFYYLFGNCQSLRTAPELPATTINTYCYANMFGSCKNLIQAPKVLPATTLADFCYDSMFQFCSNLTEPPVLPATTLAEYCYRTMFYYCLNLRTAPELPATTLAQNCYDKMFHFCISLMVAPKLPATTLAKRCYTSMFNSCKSLISIPRLPATTLAEYCYQLMFAECYNIKIYTSIGNLYQTTFMIPTNGGGTLASSALDNMFVNTGGGFTGTPSINTNYYTGNTLIS